MRQRALGLSFEVVERYPILERAIAEAPLLHEASFAETIRGSVERILDENRPRAEEDHADSEISSFTMGTVGHAQ